MVLQAESILRNEVVAQHFLRELRITDSARGLKNLHAIAQSGMTLDLFDSLLSQLKEHLPSVSDPDMSLNNLQRFIESARSALATGALFERDPTAIPILLKIFSTSQYLADLLVSDRESYDGLRLSEGFPYSRQILEDELLKILDSARDAEHVMILIRRFKHRETLRIAFGDVIAAQRIAPVTQQISFVAEACCEGAYRFCRERLEQKFGTPLNSKGEPCQYSLLALGKLGGCELNYSSDIDLIAVFESTGNCDGSRRLTNQEFFEQLTRDISKLLSEVTRDGAAYRVDLRLRPEGSQGRLCHSIDQTVRYYENKGRTWERQALIKLRPVAGDQELGQSLIDRLEPWVYQKLLSRLDISDIKVLKRKIESRADSEPGPRDVKTGHGGIRDIEFTIQFLQLLGGGAAKKVRCANTLLAIEQLQLAGFLTLNEETLLAQNYSWLRRLEHRLQIMFDLQTHRLPESKEELRKVAIRMGYKNHFQQTALEQFDEDLEEITEINRRILDHLLHDAFSGEEEYESEVPIEAELILDDQPSADMIGDVFSKFGFQDSLRAQRNLSELAKESTQFLSPHRCRHFLAAISAKLLTEISRTSNPDDTLNVLAGVTAQIGAKGVLWELFQVHHPSMELFVRLCASSDYLTQILKQNPGMIDELIDALAVDSLPSFEWLMDHMADLVQGAEDIGPIVHSFKQSQHLRVGIRDIIGRDSIHTKHRVLSDIAQVCLSTVTDHYYLKLVAKYGRPMIQEIELRGSNLVILAMGKLGGREPNYHSDLDVVFLYDGNGKTEHREPERSTSNQHFFSELASLVIKFVNDSGPQGRLYEMDCRLRPTGKSGSLVVSFEEFERYFKTGQGQLWERLALCKARVVYGNRAPALRLLEIVDQAIASPAWQSDNLREIYEMRIRMQKDCSPANIKRGKGGTVDVEFIAQLLRLQHGARLNGERRSGTLDSISQFASEGILNQQQSQKLSASYQLLRQVESGIRLMNSIGRHDLPEKESELKKLAYLLRFDDWQTLVEQVRTAREFNRSTLLQMVGQSEN